MNEKIKWGVVGAGGIARRRTIPEGILPARNATLVATCSLRAEVNQEVARRYGARPAASLEELLSADLDAVYVATPVHLHAEQVARAAAAGKHVFCEKPLGLSVTEAQTMLAACQQAGVNLGTAFMMRFQSQHVALRDLIRAGRLGRPVYARAQLSCWYPPIPGAWRQHPQSGGGGSLIDMGGHCLDLLEMLLGEVETVSCLVNSSVHPYAVEDSAVVLAKFRSGALATVDTFFCIPDASTKNRLEVYGSKGSVLAEGTIGQGEAGEMVAFLESDERAYDAGQARAAGAGMVMAPPVVNPYRAEIEAFSQALLEGRPTTESAEAGLRSQVLLAACYQSARTGAVVRLD